jgi:hypothetical protein
LSFGWMLGPAPMPAWLTVALVALAAVLSAATWWAIERPVRTSWSGHRDTVRSLVALMAVMAAVGGSAWAGVLAAGDVAVELRLDRELAIDWGHPFAPCRGAAVRPRAAPFCFEGGDPNSRRVLVVWGDSHASMWSTAFYAIGEERHLRVVLIQHGGCPPLVGVRNVDGPRGGSTECIDKGLGEDVLETIRALAPERVFLV